MTTKITLTETRLSKNPNTKTTYIQTIDHNKKDADFCKTEYKGKNYKVMYFSGCFNPYMTEIN